MNPPLISICIPTYNGQKFLATCLNSAIGQTYREIEIIIVDDFSTDKTLDIVKIYALKDSRIKIYQNEKNIGLVPNWNRCIELSKGEWIKFLFQDDYLEDTCIDQMLTDISDTDKLVALKRTFIFDSNVAGSIKNYYEHKVITFENLGIKSSSPVYIGPDQISLMAVENICLNFIGEPTVVMFKRDTVNEIGIFNQDLIQICDLEYFLRIATRYGIKYIPESLAYFRIHSQSTSAFNISTNSFVMKHLETVITTYQLLFAPAYNKFRDSLPVFKKIKLRLFFSVHVYEYVKGLDAFSHEEKSQKFREVCKTYPEVEKYKNGTLFLRFILWIVRLRRTIRTATK